MNTSIRHRTILIIGAILGALTFVQGQTLFETAEGDGTISFSKETTSQIRLNFTTTALTYGYYHVNGGVADKYRLLLNAEVKAKPNDDGIATLVKTGKLQPGFELNGLIGLRLNDILFENNWSVLDLSLKPLYKLTNFTLYDSARILSAQEPMYEETKNVLGLSFNLNFAVATGKSNLFLGLQLGINSGTNWDDLDEGSIQTIRTDPSNQGRLLFTDMESVKFGQLKNQNNTPLKMDFIFDPNIKLNKKSETTIKLGIFTYHRTDLKEKKQRTGLGLCLLDAQNPSKIYSNIGYELPAYGKDVMPESRKKDKGVVFVSIGFSIF